MPLYGYIINNYLFDKVNPNKVLSIFELDCPNAETDDEYDPVDSRVYITYDHVLQTAPPKDESAAGVAFDQPSGAKDSWGEPLDQDGWETQSSP